MIWLNGEIRKSEGAFSANDRGLLLGEAVFETLLVENHVPQFWSAHMTRLKEACKVFHFNMRFHEAELAQGLRDLMAAHSIDAALHILRLTVTGGAGGRGLVAQNPADSNWLMQLTPRAARPDYLRLHISDGAVMGGSAQSAHKTTAYLNNIMARRQALAAGADEAVLLNQHGRVAGAAAGNIFVQKGRQLITPPASEGALAGIIKAALFAAQKERGALAGLQLSEGLVGRDLLAKADALFISNSVQLIVSAGFDPHISAAQKKQGHALCEALPQFSEF